MSTSTMTAADLMRIRIDSVSYQQGWQLAVQRKSYNSKLWQADDSVAQPNSAIGYIDGCDSCLRAGKNIVETFANRGEAMEHLWSLGEHAAYNLLLV